MARLGTNSTPSALATMDEVAGLDLLKAYARTVAGSLSAEARSAGVPAPRGILLVGAPGTGKSLSAKAIGHATGLPVVRLNMGALFNSLLGESEARLRLALKTISALAPCLVWIDEAEKALGGDGRELDGGTSKRMLGELLTFMEESDDPILWVGTVNDVLSLTPPLVERFEAAFVVDLPGSGERQQMFRLFLGDVHADVETFDLAALAQASEGHSGRSLRQVVNDAARSAWYQGVTLNTELVLEHLARVEPVSVTNARQVQALRDAASRFRAASSEQLAARKDRGVQWLG